MKLFPLLLSFLPSRIKILILNQLGHEIDPSCSIGICFLDIEKITLEPNTKISNFNYFKGIKKLKLKENARIGGRLNWFTASPLHNNNQTGFGEITIGQGSNITSRHFFDAQQQILIGNNSLIAGFRSTFWTHGYRSSSKNTKKGIIIGNNCYVGSQTIFLQGARIGDNTYVGAGSVITKNHSENTYCLIAGNPAKKRKDIGEDDDFFRTTHEGFLPIKNKQDGTNNVT